MRELKNDSILSLKLRKDTNFALTLVNKSDITVRKFIFHYAINSCFYLKRQLT